MITTQNYTRDEGDYTVYGQKQRPKTMIVFLVALGIAGIIAVNNGGKSLDGAFPIVALTIIVLIDNLPASIRFYSAAIRGKEVTIKRLSNSKFLTRQSEIWIHK